MVLLIMAAGSGSRYGKLKQFDELGPSGEFLMEFSIYDAIKSGFNHIVLITKRENKDFLYNYLREKIDNSIKLDVVVQEVDNLPEGIIANSARQKPWGTAHAVWCARDYIDTDFAIINADDYYGSKAFEKAARFFNHSDDQNNYALVSYRLKNTLSEFGSVSRGVCKVSNGKLDSINEHLKIVKNENIRSLYGQGYHPNYLPAVVNRLILENPKWYTPYTPYQSEISQGRLEALLNYQTMVSDLTALPLANASLLDEATAAAEAMILLYNARPRGKKKADANIFYVSEDCFPQTIDVLKSRAIPIGINLMVTKHTPKKQSKFYQK
mgnify:CR=1 FL=1